MLKKVRCIKVLLAICVQLGLFSSLVLANQVLTVGTDAQYTTIEEALNQAQEGDTIEVVSPVEISSKLLINKRLTVVARGQVELRVLKGIEISSLGDLTLGDGSTTNHLVVNGFIDNNGKLLVRDGLTVGGRISNRNGSTYQGEGGIFEGGVEVSTGAAVQGKITGGHYIDPRGDCFDVYGSYDEIAGGEFRVETPSRGAVYIQGKLNKVSGGEFISTSGTAFHVQHGGVINEITGGTFTGVQPQTKGLMLYADGTSKARVEKISGGTFNAGYAVFMAARNTADVGIAEITGGTFNAYRSALQLEKGTKVDTITGGIFTSKSNSILNVGTIGTIAGGKFEASMYAVYNYSGGTIDSIKNGMFKAKSSAVLNASNATLNTINNGVFESSQSGYGYENLSTNKTNIEPGLSTEIGNGRYWGVRGAIYEKNSVYPESYHMSSKKTVLPVEGIEGTSFRYLKKAFTLSYDANGGKGSKPEDKQEESDDDVFVVEENPFTYVGKTFVGWNTAADGSGQTFDPKDEISLSQTLDNQTKPLGNTTLYAQWADSYTVVYDMNGANESAPVDDNDYQLGDIIKLTDMVPTKEGSQFSGWQLGELQLASGDEFELDDTVLTYADHHQLTLKARWEKTVEESQPKTPSRPSVPRKSNPKTAYETHFVLMMTGFLMSVFGLVLVRKWNKV